MARGQAVDDGHGVQAFQQPPPPLAGHGQEEKRFFKGYAVQLRQPFHSGGGEGVAAGRSHRGRGVGDGLDYPPFFQS